MLAMRIFLVLISLSVPVLSLAQSSGGATNSLESLDLRDVANDSIVMVSKEEAGTSGYINAQYVYVHSDCPGGAGGSLQRPDIRYKRPGRAPE